VTVIGAGLALSAYILISYCIGRLIVALAGLRVDALARAGSPLIGASAVAIQLWVYGVVHVPWHIALLVGPWLVAAVVWRRRFVAAVEADAAGVRQLLRGLGDLDPLTAGVLAVGVATAAFYFLNLLVQPLVGWDAIAMWLFKAKVFFDAGAVDLSLVPVNVSPPVERHLDYPPLFPLMLDSFWVLIGHVDGVIGKSIGFIFLIAAVASAAATLLPLLGKRLTALIAFLLVAMPTLQTSFVLPYYMGYADYAVAALMMISLAHLYRSARLGRDQASALSFAFAALAALTKNEGITFLIVVSIVIGAGLAWGFFKQREWPSRRLIVVAAASIIPVLAWQAYARVHGFNNDLVSQQHPQWTVELLASRAQTIATFLWHLIDRFNDYPWLVLAWIVSITLAVLSKDRRLAAVWAIVTIQAAFYCLALLLSPYAVSFLLTTAADRLILQLSPSLVLLLGLALSGAPSAGVSAQRRPGLAVAQP